jgi:glycosyltransferase involved in cell wall biosynthesis
MKILMASKALVVGAYRRKLEEIAHCPDVEIIAVVPPSWRGESHELHLEARHETGYQLVVSPIAVNGNFHLFFFPRLGQLLDEHHPDLVHVDEEPYNFATFLAAWQSARRGIPFLFFTWQNLVRRYPLPFAWMERYVYRTAAWGIAGTDAAAQVLRKKGFDGSVSVIPQFGVDPSVFVPRGTTNGVNPTGGPFTIGFAGRLVPEKGLAVLIDACARVRLDLQLVILGAGPGLGEIQAQARTCGIADRVRTLGAVPSADMPQRLREMDVLVLPSLSRPNWTEQFGRALIEGMAVGIPVIGSSSGEIPSVIGDAGLIFPEGDAGALAGQLERLATDPKLRAELGQRGRQRVIDRFTHERVASDTVQVYRQVLDARVPFGHPQQNMNGGVASAAQET